MFFKTAIQCIRQLLSKKQTYMKKKKKFEIELYDEVQVGENIDNIQLQKVVMEHPIIIEAADKKELDEHAERFKLCKQRMKIIRVIDDDKDDHTALDATTERPLLNAPNALVAQQIPAANANSQNQEAPKTKPKYYTIGGIEIKNDNGKIYQKQWMRLSSLEEKNFRIVNDTNNKIANMNGKHIEMKKWVLVETEDIQDLPIEGEIVDEQV